MKTSTNFPVQIWANLLILRYHGLWENSSFPPATFRPNAMNSKINICSMQHYRFSNVEEMSLEVGLNTHTYRLLLVPNFVFVCVPFRLFVPCSLVHGGRYETSHCWRISLHVLCRSTILADWHYVYYHQSHNTSRRSIQGITIIHHQ